MLISSKSSEKDKVRAQDILSKWRALHIRPLNTFQTTLKRKLEGIGKKKIVVQRLKRSISIVRKLERFPKMNLSRMQDIGGLRVVVDSLEEVKSIVNSYEESRIKHKLFQKKDYIQKPKESGYSGIHLIYQYQGSKDKKYNDLFIELQIRTKMQHAWATAVETIGTYLGQPLKSSIGDKTWLEYLSLVGKAFYFYEPYSFKKRVQDSINKEIQRRKKGAIEKERIELSPEEKKIYSKVTKKTNTLEVFKTLRAFRVVTNYIGDKKGRKNYLYLIFFDMAEKRVIITPFGNKEHVNAMKAYSDKEKMITPRDDASQIVLVRSESIRDLKTAYPNYFLNTEEFLQYLDEILRLSESVSRRQWF